MNKIKIKVDVVSDIVCPWCYIGKRRLEKAIAGLPADYEVEVEFLPFELNPQTPAAGINQKDHLTAKFGSLERYEELTAHVREVARQEGLTFDFEKQLVSPNTFESHRLIWFAKKEGVQPHLKEALMKAYFEDGIDLTRRENLLDVSANAGLDKAKAIAFLDSDDGKAEVKLQQQINYQRGIKGVPFFIINNKYGVSGAQTSETWEKTLLEIGAEPRGSGDRIL